VAESIVRNAAQIADAERHSIGDIYLREEGRDGDVVRGFDAALLTKLRMRGCRALRALGHFDFALSAWGRLPRVQRRSAPASFRHFVIEMEADALAAKQASLLPPESDPATIRRRLADADALVELSGGRGRGVHVDEVTTWMWQRGAGFAWDAALLQKAVVRVKDELVRRLLEVLQRKGHSDVCARLLLAAVARFSGGFGREVSGGGTSDGGADADAEAQRCACISIMKRLLIAGADPNGGAQPTPANATVATDAAPPAPSAISPLLLASSDGSAAPVVSLLIARGALKDIARSSDGMTPLHNAAACGHVGIVRALLAPPCADVRRATRTGSTPLIAAAEGGHCTVVSLLVEAGAPIDAVEESGSDALWNAARGGHANIVRMLLALGAPAARATLVGVTPLWIAARHGHAAVIDLLLATPDGLLTLERREFLRKGAAGLAGGDSDGTSPLYIAAQCGQVDAVRSLLLAHADVDARFDGDTPCHVAELNSHFDIVDLLREHTRAQSPHSSLLDHSPLAAARPSDPPRRRARSADESPATCAKYACEHGDDAALRELLERGVSPNASMPVSGTSLLHVAAWYGQRGAASALCDAGANVGCTTRQSRETPLHHAARNGCVAVAELLLLRGACADAMTVQGHTPLHLAATTGAVAVVALLVDRTRGWTPAKLSPTLHSDGTTPLLLAVQHGHVDVVRALCEGGCLNGGALTRGGPRFETALDRAKRLPAGKRQEIVALLEQTRESFFSFLIYNV